MAWANIDIIPLLRRVAFEAARRYGTGDMESDVANPDRLGTVPSALRLVELLRVGPADQQLSELAKRADLTLQTVYRLLRSLTVSGLVTKDPDSPLYSLGPEFIRLSQHYLMRQPVVQALSPYLVQLRNTTGATIQVALLSGDSVVYVDRIDGAHTKGIHRISHRVHPALDTAAGRVLLARADLDVWKQATDASVTIEQRNDWAQSLYLALADPYVPDSVEVAVPVTDERGRTLASLSATDCHERFTLAVITEGVVPHLLRATKAVRHTANRT